MICRPSSALTSPFPQGTEGGEASSQPHAWASPELPLIPLLSPSLCAGSHTNPEKPRPCMNHQLAAPISHFLAKLSLGTRRVWGTGRSTTPIAAHFWRMTLRKWDPAGTGAVPHPLLASPSQLREGMWSRRRERGNGIKARAAAGEEQPPCPCFGQRLNGKRRLQRLGWQKPCFTLELPLGDARASTCFELHHGGHDKNML